MCREATYKDLPTIIKFLRAFHKASCYSNEPFDPVYTAETVECLMDDPRAVIFIHDTGIIGGGLDDCWFNGEPYAAELFWYAESKGIELLKAFENWAKDQGAKSVTMVHLSSEDRVSKIYKRRGYKVLEHAFSKELV